MHQPRKYPSKLLLTGEYTVLLGYPAIAIPWPGHYAAWKDEGALPDATLQKFHQFISNHPELKNHFLLDEFYSYIQNGGYLESNIPFGYGLGSSGSFCAAIFDRFGIADTKADCADEETVFAILKKMEHFFHGQSSGLDPMVSYYNCAVQIFNGKISFPTFNGQELLSQHRLYLVDSKLKRDTQHLVSCFKEMIKDPAYLTRIKEEIVPVNNAIIQALLQNDFSMLDANWIKLSQSCVEIFHNMIPETFNDFWRAGIASHSYYCKLCGAGGGGLFLAKVMDEEHFMKQIKYFGIEVFM